MKTYLFTEKGFGETSVILIPNLAVIYPDSKEVIIRKKIVSEVSEQIQRVREDKRIAGDELIGFRGEIDVPSSLIEEIVGWQKSEDISKEEKKQYTERLKSYIQ